jgi:hypothetical protein
MAMPILFSWEHVSANCIYNLRGIKRPELYVFNPVTIDRVTTYYPYCMAEAIKPELVEA